MRPTFAVIALLAVALQNGNAQVSVWTNHNDNSRTGANLSEVQLNTTTVSAASFGKLFSYAVDGQIYAQPLYIPNVSIPGKGVHNVVYVATMNDSVYAFDADSNSGANASPLWQVNFTNPAAGVTTIPADPSIQPTGPNIIGTIGIVSTPVIDQSTGTMYLVAHTKENSQYFQRLHALDITTGAEKFGGPQVIQATVPGNGYDAAANKIKFNAFHENQRSGLSLANGKVYMAWGSHDDYDPYHGWVMAYDAATLQQVAVLNTTPDGGEGGIWGSGQPLAIDSNGNLYVPTGNGDWDGTRNFGSSILRLSPTLAIQDWFTPDNYNFLNVEDLDVGVSGIMLMPNSNRLLQGSKTGTLYLLQRDNLGHNQSGNGQVPQVLDGAAPGHIHGSPVYWNGPTTGPMIYIWGENDYLKAFHFNGTTLDPSPVSQSSFPASAGMPGAILSISANGSSPGSGLLWASMPVVGDAEFNTVPGALRVFDAADLSTELWNSTLNLSRDDVGNFAKFSPPTIANSKVYLASFSNRLNVYGLLNTSPDFVSQVSPKSRAGIGLNSSTNFVINTTYINGFADTTTFSVTGLPAGVAATFNPASISASGNSTLTLTTGSAVAFGTYNLTITGTANGGISHSISASLEIDPPDFSNQVAPSTATVLPGGATSYQVTLTGVAGFAGLVNLSVSGTPANASATFNPPTITGSGQSTLTIIATGATPVGSYPLTVNATSGTSSHPASVNLVVAPGPTGLVDGFSFDEGSGTQIHDVSPNANIGTLVNAPTWTAQGKYAGGLALGGVGYVSVANPDLPTGNFTWMMWLNRANLLSYQNLMEAQGSTAAEMEFNLENGKLVLWSSGVLRLTSSGTVPSGVWAHVAVTRASGAFKVYINGIADSATGTDTRTFNFGACPLLIGIDADTGCTGSMGGKLNATVDEVRIYNRALTQAEIQTAMNTSLTTVIDTTPPARSNGQPTGALTAGTTQASISLATDENSTCRYSTTAGVAYGSMTNVFTVTGAFAHSTTVTGLTNAGSFNYYVRCQDTAGNPDTTDFAISFTVAADTTPPDLDNGKPVGALAAGTTQATLSVATNENATCRYATTAGVPYASMTNVFTVTGALGHSTTLTGLTDGSSYSYYVRCQDTAGNPDTTDFLISFTVGSDTTPPVRSNGQPTGALAAATTQTSLGLATDENATCRYSTAAGVPYASMTNVFTVTGAQAHSTTVTGLTSGGSFNYYVRCQDTAGNPDTTDFLISFTVAADTTPPVRSNGQPTGSLALGTTQTTISLATDENATCRYAATTGVAYGSMTNVFAVTGALAHNTTVTGLSDGGSFNYYVRCQDTAGNPDATDFLISFTVAADTTPPVRSNGQPTGTLALGTTQTTISLATNENATCRYATSAGVAYGSMPNAFAVTGALTHSTTVTGLTNGGSFSYYVRCQDTAGNPDTTDFLISFSVAGDTTPPVRSNGQPTGTLAFGTTQTTISLSTDENATCRYATSAGVAYGSMPNAFAVTGAQAHSTTVTGLTNGGSFNYYVRCQDTAGNPDTTDFLISFSVAGDTTPPVRSNGLPTGTLAAGTTQTTISLATNEVATCRYATTTGVAYASMTNTFTTTSGTTHSRTVTGLTNGGSYNYYVRCQDTAGNANTSDFAISFSVAQPPPNGLVVAYALNDGSGSLASDVTGNGHSGTLVNSPVWTPTGKYSGGLVLNGTTNYIRTDNPGLPTGNFTWMLWVNPSNVTSFHTLMEAQGTTAAELEMNLQNGKVSVWSSGNARITTNGSIPTNTWTHVALTRSGNTMKVYFNGVADSVTGSDSRTFNFSTCPMFVGIDADSGCTGLLGGYLSGTFDEVRVYNRALSQSEIQAAMNTPVIP